MTTTDKATMAVGLLGAGAVTTGAALLHPSAGWIVGGVFGLAWSYLTARAAARGAA
ncbi:hypothetical protein ACPRNU_23870 [Chromobacterium vaccinii]|uniref:Uncharacterized protein n=1 Tax=Chromobacterium indicum TaxID=3110228 RepID=A0ABV0CE80_9NEIS|nr:hypothetical protein [Chromobacterium violaceum]MCD0492330.1 hypothetical protein [Chromobacterium violaceum]